MSGESMEAEWAKLRVEELLRPWDAIPKPWIPTTSAYLKALRAAASEQAQRVDEEGAAQAVCELAPLDERLKRLIAARYSLEEQRAGLSLPLLATCLRGRQRAHASVSETAASLRRLGFVRFRNWRGEEGFRALWRKGP
jgi:hypothetical protein